MTFLYLVQLVTLVSGSCVRFHSMKHVGKYSLNVVRPYSYKLKHFTIGLLGLALIGHIIFICITQSDLFEVSSNQFFLVLLEIIRLVLQVLALILASVMIFFEYRRALGHIWYVHFLFFLSGTILYGVDIVMLSINFEKVQKYRRPYLILFNCLECLLSLVLTIFTRVFPSDFPYERRNYINVDDRERALKNFHDSGSTDGRTRRGSSVIGYQH